MFPHLSKLLSNYKSLEEVSPCSVLDQICSKDSWVGGESLSLVHIHYAKHHKNSLIYFCLDCLSQTSVCLCFFFSSSPSASGHNSEEILESQCNPN